MIFTIGHSTHTQQEFLAAARGIDRIIDVRSHPTSRWEQHRKQNLEIWLPEAGIAYEWMPSLGGWTARHFEQYADAMGQVGVDLAVYSNGTFPKQRIGADRPDSESGFAWTNQGLYDYAWYMATDEFLDGADDLIARFGASDEHVAIMCAEALWWKCHRSMVADYLHFRRIFVGHLPPKPPVRETTPRWKAHADAIGTRLLRYPPDVPAAWLKHVGT